MTISSIQVVSSREELPRRSLEIAYLLRDSWNDYGFGTTFQLLIPDSFGFLREVGALKIGFRGMQAEQFDKYRTVFTPVPDTFDGLGPGFFSVGQSREYYEGLSEVLGRVPARRLLGRLRDLAVAPGDMRAFEEEPVYRLSLFRDLSSGSVRDQFHRIIGGVDAKDRYVLEYALGNPQDQVLRFEVEPDRTPPTNVHALIGPNGAGKTRVLRRIRLAFDDREEFDSEPSYITQSDWSRIAGVVSVSFSAFDAAPEALQGGARSDVRFSTIGLVSEERGANRPMSAIELKTLFDDSLARAIKLKRRTLEQALGFLADDPILARFQLQNASELLNRLDFGSLSSGHKIVLLTIVRLVLLVEERTLVLIDEPESHLHPPLVAAFTRALSWLMTDRNGLAIVATHSPVVLQEIPKRCAWILWSAGSITVAHRPPRETFGENIGVLTRDAFRFDLGSAGFVALLKRAAEREGSYELALESFHDELGVEARAILRSITSRAAGQ